MFLFANDNSWYVLGTYYIPGCLNVSTGWLIETQCCLVTLVISPFHRCRNWGTERLNILSLVTDEQRTGRIGPEACSVAPTDTFQGSCFLQNAPRFLFLLCCADSLSSSQFSYQEVNWPSLRTFFFCFLPACVHACMCMHTQACPCTFMARLWIFHLALTLFEWGREMSVYP